MLSIRFVPDGEWWVSGTVFDRLFQSALRAGEMPEAFEPWRHIADANGGLSLAKVEPGEADVLKAGLASAADRELRELGDAGLAPADETYRASLRKLLKVAGAVGG